jgi:hypothetical protein
VALIRLVALSLALVLAGCTSTLPDAMADTIEATRPANVRAMEGMAEAAVRLPAALDDASALTGEVAQVASSTALAIARLADLAGTLDQAARAALVDVAATSEQRARILETIAAIGSTTESLLGRADALAARWEGQAEDLRQDEARAVRALADLAEASARTGAETAAIAEAVARVAKRVEPELAQGAGSAARLLASVDALTARLASDEVASGAVAVNALAGALGAGVVVALALLVRVVFRRAVEREVLARSGRA